MAEETQVAVIHRATTGRQRTIVGTLATIAGRVREEGVETPALAVFGEVVGLRERLGWFEVRPLLGRRIVVTRSRRQAGELGRMLEALGAHVIELPTIRIEPPANPRSLAEAVRDAHRYDWIVFTSPNGVEAFFNRFFEEHRDARAIGAARIAAIGPATARRVESYHLQVDAQPAEAVSERILDAIRKELGGPENLTFLLPRAEGARDALPRLLEAEGAIVDEVVAYRTVRETEDRTGAKALLRAEGADLIVFTSSSTATNFLALDLPLPPGTAVASIGPITSATLRERGVRVDVEAPEHDIPGLVRAIAAHWAVPGPAPRRARAPRRKRGA